MSFSTILLFALALAGGTLAFRLISLSRRCAFKGDPSMCLPPGPPSLPLIGNALDISAKNPGQSFADLAKKYGDIVCLHIFGETVLVINSLSIAKDLLEKRSRIYSGRPQYATYKSYGADLITPFLDYGDPWRLHRRLFNQTMRQDMIESFRPAQKRSVQQLLSNLSSSPKAWDEHAYTFASGAILSTTYDYNVQPRADPLVQVFTSTLDSFTFLFSPVTPIILSVMPFLKLMPPSLPGGILNAKAFRTAMQEMINMPFNILRARKDAGKSASCIATTPVPRTTMTPAEVDFHFKGFCTSVFGGGAGTTSETLRIFVLLMVQNLHVQVRATREIDAVVGRDRLPDFEDREAMPYVEAVAREVMRWQPVAPLGVPHSSTEDDTYGGYFIPKGSVIIPNIREMSHDPTKYPRPDDFLPERFLAADGTLKDSDETDLSFIFGFGRRVCPGRHFANASLWIAIANLLAVFEFRQPKNDKAEEVPVVPEWTYGLTS
ncbi:cytochrome P450 [Coniophora puteana RWD-64-598 SS2]|uniref:Cytochrome P450 n=1 Tax=Coniophora puteana (strain RWD-64-598) TaxID=741705 RepID=A0A5M3N0K0_CONPW|nr:cytochrome P450 [Coniophora puteana RWD-64-598 SS2]EIW84564.1 cytochrome P450 [Coniophora puteana RWD-64-598 SS2]